MINHLIQFFKDSIANAIGIVFAMTGVIFGTWAALIPFVKNKFALDEAGLGIFLMMLPLGATCMNPLSVPFIRKFGPVTATLLSLVLLGFTVTLPVNMPTVWLSGAMLFLQGMGYSAINITMNTCATQLEMISSKSIMATCHGLWSGGAMIGSAATGIAVGWGVHPAYYVIGIALFATIVAWAVKKTLNRLPPPTTLPDSEEKKQKVYIRPNKDLWILIIIGLCVNLGEGTMADWAAVYVKDVMNTSVSVASWGFATYAFFMMSGRLLGDGLVNRFGSMSMLRGCGVLLTTGYLLAVISPNVVILFAGLALIGLGVSLGSPILYAASSKVPGLPPGAGLAIYNTYAVVAFLGGPVIIGFLARAFSLPIAFLTVALTGVVWVVLARDWRTKKAG